MKKTYANLVLFLGVACFFIGAASLIMGRLEESLAFALPVLGLILIGAGAASKRKLEKE